MILMCISQGCSSFGSWIWFRIELPGISRQGSSQSFSLEGFEQDLHSRRIRFLGRVVPLDGIAILT